MRPKGMSTTYRLPLASNDGPSIKQSVGWPGRLASAHEVATPFLRNFSGIDENTRVSIRSGGVSRYIMLLVHLCWQNGRTINDRCGSVDWLVILRHSGMARRTRPGIFPGSLRAPG